MNEKLDKTDLRILSTLQKQARITNQELAKLVHLSPSSCLTRVRRLEKKGVLENYFAKLNLNAICRNVMCIAMVSIKSQSKGDFKKFKDHTDQEKQIISCYTVSGEFDFFLQIISPDMENYLLVTDKLIDSVEPEVIINTHVVMQENKSFSGYPLEQLL